MGTYTLLSRPLVLLLFLTAGCFRDPKTEREKFIAAHRSESFAAFQNKKVFIRSTGHDGNAIVFFSSSALDSLCSHAASIIIVRASPEERKVLSVDYKLIKPACRAQAKKFELDVISTVKKFVDYDITSIHADSEGNVYFGIAPYDGTDVMKLVTQKALDDNKVDLLHYVGMGDSWYKKAD